MFKSGRSGYVETMSWQTGDALLAPRTLATAAGSYVTDGRRLFRVVSPLAAPPELEAAELEDCMTLESDCYTAGELWAMRLILVRRADPQPGATERATPPQFAPAL
jgi:hypothetical protein